MATDMASLQATVGEMPPDSRMPRSMRDEVKNPGRRKAAARASSEPQAIDNPTDARDGAGDAMARLERRLSSLETTVAKIADIVERHEISLREREDTLASVAESVMALGGRIELSEKRQAGETAELRAALAEACVRLNNLEAHANAPVHAPAAAQPPAGPVFADPPVVWGGEIDKPVLNTGVQTPTESGSVNKGSESQSYLSAARRAANANTAPKDKKSAAATTSRRFPRAQLVAFGCAAPLMVVATASFVLNHHPATAEPVPAPSAFTPAPQPVSALPPPPQIMIGAPADPTAAELASSGPLVVLQGKAQAGDATAERDIGLKYLAGDNMAVNEEEAARWLLRASYRGEPAAEYWLGTLYSRGHGVPADAFQANHWYGASAKQGNRNAMHRLGIANFEGLGMQNNPEQAAQWFTQAAELGLVDSQFDLAVLYERGEGVKQSLVDAYKWYEVAATQGDQEAASRAAALSKALKPDELAQADRAAAQFKPQSTDESAKPATTTP